MKRLSPSQQEAIDPSTKSERLRELVSKSKTHENLVAGNRSTPADLLIALSKKGERRINERLAKNPSTPLPILLPLVQKFPREFLANPVLPLLFLEDSFASSLTQGAYEALISCPEAPAIFCQWALQRHPSMKIRSLIAKHPNANADLLEQLARSTNLHDQECCASILYHPNRTPKIVAILATIGSVMIDQRSKPIPLSPLYQALFERTKLFQRGSTMEPIAEEDLYELAELGVVAQQMVASQRNCPHSLLYSLSEKDSAIKTTIAQNPSAPPELLFSIAKEHYHSTYYALANPSFPEEHLAHFANGSYQEYIRCAAVNHPKIPTATLQSLLQDPEHSVRYTAKKNLSTRAMKDC